MLLVSVEYKGCQLNVHVKISDLSPSFKWLATVSKWNICIYLVFLQSLKWIQVSQSFRKILHLNNTGNRRKIKQIRGLSDHMGCSECSERKCTQCKMYRCWSIQADSTPGLLYLDQCDPFIKGFFFIHALLFKCSISSHLYRSHSKHLDAYTTHEHATLVRARCTIFTKTS